MNHSDRLAGIDSNLVRLPLCNGRQVARAFAIGRGAVLGLPPGPAFHESVAQHAAGELGRPVEAGSDVRGGLADLIVAVRRERGALVG